MSMDRSDDYLFDPSAPADPEVAAFERKLAPFRADAQAAPTLRLRRVPPLLRLIRDRRVAAALLAASVVAGAVIGWSLRDGAPRSPDSPTSPTSPTSQSSQSSQSSQGTPDSVATAGASVDVALTTTSGAVSIESLPRPLAVAPDGAPAGAPQAECDATLRAGDSIVCGAGATARLRVGGVGFLELEEQTRLRVAAGHGDDSREGAFHLELERGTVAATIFAAPRVFALGTPAGIAVDMGCIYRTTVDDEGHTFLSVVAGSVSFESDGRKVHVPSGAGCRAWPGFGPGTPSWDESAPALKQALQHHDEARGRRDGAAAAKAIDELFLVLDTAPATPAARDSLSLWHLLDAPEPALRARIVERLAALVPPPEGVARESCLAGDAEALAAWRTKLADNWKRAY